ncbi:UDP-N-acetylmuramate--L-alanine ligase [Candidatus Omnitrophota bacterium]
MKRQKRVHFIGIGGAGMSGLAEIFYCHGYDVQGSDINKTKVTDRLEAMGIRINNAHLPENIEGAHYVVHSSCITEDNAEFKEAKQRNMPMLRRMEALNMLVGNKDIVAVSGAHGKTTTTSLISYLLIQANLDPTVFIGANVSFIDGNARCGQSNIVVTEADESDGSFLLLNPLYSVSTNIDREHMDYYSNMDNMIAAYKEFIENTKDEGCVFACIDDLYLKGIIKSSSKRIMTYGVSQNADIRADNIELLGLDGARFDLVFENKTLGRINISITGMHNVLNSLAAIGVVMNLGVGFSAIKKAIVDFRGADRRFAITRLDSDILVIDDYAHHPTEIKVTLEALRGSGKRIVAVFQPHRYSRTRYLREEFGSCFDLADHLVITEIYSAHEEPIDGVSAKDICDDAKKFGHKNVHFISKDDIIKHLVGVVRPGDAVFILGAGDIGKLPERIVRTLEGVKRT